MNKKIIFLCFVVIFSVTSCAGSIPKDAFVLSKESLQDRQTQSRKFETKDEKNILSAGAQVLQDMGFTLEESETSLGVIVASKTASAVNGGQVAGMILLAALGGGVTPIDKEQKIRVSVVSRPFGEKQTGLRVTFQRVVWNTQGQICRTEFLDDPVLYQDFFTKLSKSVFLVAHQI